MKDNPMKPKTHAMMCILKPGLTNLAQNYEKKQTHTLLYSENLLFLTFLCD